MPVFPSCNFLLSANVVGKQVSFGVECSECCGRGERSGSVWLLVGRNSPHAPLWPDLPQLNVPASARSQQVIRQNHVTWQRHTHTVWNKLGLLKQSQWGEKGPTLERQVTLNRLSDGSHCPSFSGLGGNWEVQIKETRYLLLVANEGSFYLQIFN